MIWRAYDLVGLADAMVHVGEQGVGEGLSLAERSVLRRRVERCSEHAAVGVGKISGAVTQRLTLNRSTGCRGFWVPPKQNPVASLVSKRHVDAVVIGKGKTGGDGAW
jgi:hypothetical protein